MSKHASRGGFTLAELLVALAVIAVLIAVMIPMISGVLRERSEEMHCTANLRRVGQALHLYLGEHQNTLPGPMYFGQRYVYGPTVSTASRNLAHFLITYLGIPTPRPGEVVEVSELLCPAWKRLEMQARQSLPVTCMGVTERINRDGRTRRAPFGDHRETPPTPPARLTELPGELSDIWAVRDPFTRYAPGADGFVHGERRNFLFFDGHVRALKPDPNHPNRDPNL